MSNVGLNWSNVQRCRTPADKDVLKAIANRANKDQGHSCFPTVRQLVDDTQLGESTVRRALRNLSCDGKIRIFERWKTWGGRRSSRYQLLLQGPQTPLPPVVDWKRIYVYVPRPRGVDEGIPLAAAGIADQGEHVDDRGEDRFVPADAAGTNCSQREVSNEQEVEPSGFDPKVENPFPPTPGVDEPAGDVAQAATGGGENSPPDPKPDDPVAQIRRHRPRWKMQAIREALDEAVAEDRDRAHAERALLALAADRVGATYGRTMSPRRLNAFEGDWWADTRPRPPKPAGPPRCSAHPQEPVDRCLLCELLRRATAPVAVTERVGPPSQRARSELWAQTQARIAAGAAKWTRPTNPRLVGRRALPEAA